MARGGRKCAASVRFPERGEADVAAEKRFGAVLPAFGIFHQRPVQGAQGLGQAAGAHAHEQPVAPRAQPTRPYARGAQGRKGAAGNSIASGESTASSPAPLSSARPVRQGIFARAPPAMRVPGRSG